MPMTPKLAIEFVKLMREHFRLQAETRTLAAILQTAVTLNQPPLGWLDALKLARETPAYRNISEQFSAQLVQLEQSLETKDLDDLLAKIPPTEFLN